MADDFRYHIDHHGSLVRPAGLRAARAAGEPEALTAAEEEAVIAALHMQRRLSSAAVHISRSLRCPAVEQKTDKWATTR